MMYERDKNYKFNVETDNKFTSMYTGKLLEEDDISVRILTVKGEDIVLRKDNIMKAIMIGEMEIGTRNI